jgi:protein-disulfide isomerase
MTVAGVGTWTDVFALGVLLVEMLSLSALARGEEPFWAAALQKPEGLPGLVTTRRLDVPPAVWQVALAALQATASQRPADASALRAALKGAWSAPGVAATQASAPPRPVGFQSVNFGMETLASPAGGNPVTPATPSGFAPTGLAPTVGATPIPMGGTPVPAVAPPLAPLPSGGMPPTMAMPSFGGTLATPPGGAASALPGMPGWNPASSGASAYGPPTPKKMSDLAFWAMVGALAVLLLGGLSVWAIHRRDGDDEHQGQSHGAAPDAAVPEAPVPPTTPPLPLPTPTPPLVPIPPPQEAARRVVPLEDSPARGPTDALVTMVEFSEFQCPFCSRVQPTLQQLTERYPRDLRIVWKHRPLPFHQQARPAAEASLAAHAQGRFWEMHDQLFANQRLLAPEVYEDLARNIELDRRPFRRAMEDHSFLHVLERDQALSERLRHNMGTPTFYVNGRELVGAQPLDRFVTVIEACRSEALETLRTNPSVTREGYYDHLMARFAAAPGGAPAP